MHGPFPAKNTSKYSIVLTRNESVQFHKTTHACGISFNFWVGTEILSKCLVQFDVRSDMLHGGWNLISATVGSLGRSVLYVYSDILHVNDGWNLAFIRISWDPVYISET